MSRKALILDIDGTLTNSKKEITEKTLQAILEVQEKGHIVIIASGRPTHGVKWIADALKLSEYGGYVLCFNGARITNVKTGEVVYQQEFPKECIAPLYDYAIAHDMGLVTYEGDSVITGTRKDEYMEFEARLNNMELRLVENYKEYVGDDSFLASATKRTSALMEKVNALFALERHLGGVLDIDAETVSSLTSYAPGYIDKENELIVGMQTNRPLKRGVNPFGGMRMARQACEAYGYKLNQKIEDEFRFRTTHNDGVFRAYTDEMRQWLIKNYKKY